MQQERVQKNELISDEIADFFDLLAKFDYEDNLNSISNLKTDPSNAPEGSVFK